MKYQRAREWWRVGRKAVGLLERSQAAEGLEWQAEEFELDK